MLFEFLDQYKKEIIQLCKEKVLAEAQSKPRSELLDRGLPIFYNELIEVLRKTTASNGISLRNGNPFKEGAAAAHGKESLRLGYTISQVVHAYGAICQSITEFSQTKAHAITSNEFHDLNLCLDCAIAEAVTEFEKGKSENILREETERLGFLIHEMGNSFAVASIAAASIAHKLIQEGRLREEIQILNSAHERIRGLIYSSQGEVRLRGEAPLERTQICLMDIINEVKSTARAITKLKEVHLSVDVEPSIHLTANRHQIFSAVSNLVNNAMKFTKTNGHVSVKCKEVEGHILIEVEDECGGLPEGAAEDLFKPFVQKGTDKSGMGLGLSLSRQAIESHQGKLTARNIPGKGCSFMIDLPKSTELALSAA